MTVQTFFQRISKFDFKTEKVLQEEVKKETKIKRLRNVKSEDCSRTLFSW
jgi:hypothetical protein